MDELKNKKRSTTAYAPPKRKITPEFGKGVSVAPSVPIAPTLKMLGVGEVAEFPTEQRSSVYATIHRLRKDYKRQGWDVEIIDNECDDNNLTVRIKRVS